MHTIHVKKRHCQPRSMAILPTTTYLAFLVIATWFGLAASAPQQAHAAKEQRVLRPDPRQPRSQPRDGRKLRRLPRWVAVPFLINIEFLLLQIILARKTREYTKAVGQDRAQNAPKQDIVAVSSKCNCIMLKTEGGWRKASEY
jgi:hypothetical protein